ncbi:hypothetical protein OH76DRAFT_1490336 [Lentinus brumalis]|uniref:Uncharacterized protein n=1 Tax=Lentinus brumalis TaxID=2498619 RepID=A0A371CJD3_9APHY|nr:hypothetical protein OH76DRAFT_1490336 [Polyporus brumalis]
MARSTDPQTAAESNQSIGTAIIMPHPTEAVDVQLSEYAVAEGNKGKIRFLEQENETLVSERLVLKQRCENLDSQLASVTLSLETASVKAVNLEWQLQDATQKWEEERRDKDSDIQALTEMLAGLQTSSARSTMAGLPSSPANRPQRAMDTPWPTSSWVPPHATWAPDFPTSPVSPSSRSSEPPLSPLISPDFAPLMTCDYLDKTTVPAPTSHPQTTPRNTPQSLNISFTQPIYGAGDAISHAGTPEAPSAYRCSAGQCAPDVAGKLPGAAVISGPPQSSKHDVAQGVASASHISPDADLVSADRYNPHRRRSFLRYPHAPVKADMDSQSPNEPVANGSHSVQALGDSARVAPPGTSVGDAPQHQFYTFMRFVADTLYPLLFHLVGEAFTAKVRKIERTFSPRPPVVAVAAAAIIATVANGPGTIISRCGVLLVSVTLSTSTTYSPSLIARLCFTHVKKWRLAVAGFVLLLFLGDDASFSPC